MAYSTNPYLPNVRRQAVTLVFGGQSIALVARKFGIHRTTVWRWCRLPGAKDNRVKLINRSCRPHTHPKQLAQVVIERIRELRHQYKRCAGYIHALLTREGVSVSLASVSRTLARLKLSSSWYGRKGKLYRKRMPRPKVAAPGSFLQLDTIHFTNWRATTSTPSLTLRAGGRMQPTAPVFHQA
jgi:transposase-like protein